MTNREYVDSIQLFVLKLSHKQQRMGNVGNRLLLDYTYSHARSTDEESLISGCHILGVAPSALTAFWLIQLDLYLTSWSCS